MAKDQEPKGDVFQTAMRAFDFDLSMVTPNQPPEVQRAAVAALLDKFFLSHITILPTPGEALEETQRLFHETLERLQKASNVLTKFLRGDGGDPEAKAEALNVKNFIDVFIEAAQELADDIVNPRDNEDPAGAKGEDGVAIRGPFVYFPRPGPCHERSFALEVECGGCGTVVKEFRGLQLRRRRVVITRVIEPWFSRRRIIKIVVWVLEWVPAQMIKTISVRCCGDHTKTHIDKQIVLDRELMTFWRCF